MRLPSSLHAFWKKLKNKSPVRVGTEAFTRPGRRRPLRLEQLEDRVTPTALNLFGNFLSLNTLGIDVTANGGISANLNGVVTTADPGVYDSIDYFPGLMGNNVLVYNTNVPFSMESARGFLSDSISVGNGLDGVQGIKATVDLTKASSIFGLGIGDGTDTVGQTATITANSVTGLAPAPILFNHLGELDVEGGSGNNTFTVSSTGIFPIYLETNGNDTAYVRATNASLEITHRSGGYGTITVGSEAASLDPIQGPLHVIDLQNLVGLFVLDQGSITPQSYTLSDSDFQDGLLNQNWAFSRSGAAVITYDVGVSLSVVGGSGGNSFNILNTGSSATTIETGAANDFVHVQKTTGELNINNTGGNDTVTIGADVTEVLNGFPILLGRTLANINGSVAVYGAGSTSLYLDDSADSSGANGSMFDGELAGLSPSPILWTPSANPTGGVTYLNVQGPSGTGFNQFNLENQSNFFTVYNTSNLYSGTYLLTNSDSLADFQHFHVVNILATTGAIFVDGGNGVQQVDIGSILYSGQPGSVANINGSVHVFNSGSSGFSSLEVDDSGDTNNQTANLYDGSITGLAPAAIDWTANSPTAGGVGLLGVFGGSGANTFNVFGTRNFFAPANTYDPLTDVITGGNGLDTVNVRATSGTLLVENYDLSGQGSPETDTIGSLAPGLGGTLANINGPVYVFAVPGTNLFVDDSGDTTSRTATLTTSLLLNIFKVTSLTGLSPAPINWDFKANFSPSVAIYGGSGGNSFNVLNTAESPTLIHTGLGNDFVHVQGTTGSLNVNNDGGSDTVTIGADVTEVLNGFPILLGRTLANINGPVDVYGAGSTSLYVDDSADTTGPNGSMHDGELAGLSPAPILWTPSSNPTGGVTYLNVKAGSTSVPGNTYFSVFNTSNLYFGTYLLSNSDSAPLQNIFHAVYIAATAGAITVDGGYGNQNVIIGDPIPSVPHTLDGTLANIHGAVDIVGSDSGADNVLTADDSADPNGHTVNLYDGRITGLAPAPIYWTPNSMTTGGVNYVNVIGGTGNDTFNVFGTSSFLVPEPGGPLPGATNIVTGSGLDSINVLATTGELDIANLYLIPNQVQQFIPNSINTITIGSLAPAIGGTLANINGPVEVTYGGSLIVDDSGDTASRTATLATDPIFTALDLSGLSPAPILDFVGTGSLSTGNFIINGSSGANTYNIRNTHAGMNTVLNAGSGNDVVNVGSGGNTSTLDSIQGPLTVNSQTSQTALNFNDQGSTTGQAYALTSTSLSRSGAATITYDPVTSLAINAGSGNDSLTVVNTAPGTPVAFNGGGGVNTLIGPDFASTFIITSLNAGRVGNVTFSSVQNLVGGAGNDSFAFRTGGRLTGSINGGGGMNTLNYSAYVGTVVVDLPLHIATAVSGGIVGIQNVNGSIGNDLIVGDGNGNLLQGGTGRNIIIGGAGPDQITGGGGDNILIGGTTLWDANLTALQAIFQEWINPTLTFDQRVNALKKGIVVNGITYALNSSTVHADNSPDSLIGGSGRNWFFVDFDDVINNGNGPGPNDRVTRV